MEIKNVAILVIVAGKILCVSRKDNPNDFGLPGGKIEKGESPFTAAVRELLEETGLKILDDSMDYYKERETLTFVCRNHSGIINTTEPHDILLASSWTPLLSGSFKRYNKNLRNFVRANGHMHRNIPVLSMVQELEQLESE